MDFGSDKVVVGVSDAGLQEHITRMLTEAGYQVFAEFPVTLKTVLTTMPDVIVLGGNSPDPNFGDVVAEVKGAERSRHIRVIMLVMGGSAERTRDLDLGADDVLSMPFEDRELMARVRAELREKRPEDELRDIVRNGRNSSLEARRLRRVLRKEAHTMRLGFAFLAALALLVGAGIAFVYSRSQKQNVRVYTAIAKLQTSVSGEQEPMDLSRRARAQAEKNVADVTEARRQNLKRENKELHDKMATADPAQMAELEHRLHESNERLQRLETESTVAQEVIRSYSSSVCLLHVAFGFRDKGSGLPLRYASVHHRHPRSPLADENGQVRVQIGGFGPEVRMDTLGTGFLASSDGRIVTNHHVVEPWWKNEDVNELLAQAPDLEPVALEITAYFPGIYQGIPLKVQKISSDADLAIVSGDVSGRNLKFLAIDDSPKAAISGQPVVLIGYPTGIDAILARSSEESVRSIASSTNGDLENLIAELAHRNLIRPINTQGHIGDVLADKIIYDAQTTSGGSGGPLFNSEGKVIAINVAMLRDFGGSNFAIPARFAKPLLPK